MDYREGYLELLAERSTLKAKNKALLAALESLTEAASEQLPQDPDHDGLTNCDLLAKSRAVIAKANGDE
jgi:hypothetical protein